jgi:predicted Zn-dependent protease with MMP-like domain/Flp pilus assembly protein TadD
MADALDALLDQAGQALDDGRAEEALRLARKALERDPREPTALSFEADALAMLERVDEGAGLLEEAARRYPTDPDILLAAASFTIDWLAEDHEAVEQALERIRKGLKLARKRDDERLEGDLYLVESRALCELGDLRGSAQACEQARAALGDDPEVLLELAMARFEVLQLDEAEVLLKQIAAEVPDEPRAHHYLGLVAERRGDAKAAARHFAKARLIDPEAYPKPVELSHKGFSKAAESALEKLPERIRDRLANVPVMVEDLPRDEDINGDPPLSPLSLGMFRGPSLRDKSLSDPWSELPASILLFKKNLERDARTRAELVEQIEETIVHEVGHFVGWDDEDLHERGLD